MTTSKPKRRLLQFSLRTLFVLMTIFAVWFGWKMNAAREQAKAVAWVEEMGGTVRYDYEVDSDGLHIKDATTPGPKWLRKMLGIDFMDEVVLVDVTGTQISDLSPLAGLNPKHLLLADTQVCDLKPLIRFKHLETLYVSRMKISDVTSLAGLKLRELNLDGTQVSDLTPLAAIKSLQYLSLVSTQVSDLTPIAELKNLEDLSLDGTQVSNLTPLASIKNLRALSISNTQVSDLTPLAGMKHLEVLDVTSSPASDLTPLAELENLALLLLNRTRATHIQVYSLRKALPNCQIVWIPTLESSAAHLGEEGIQWILMKISEHFRKVER